MKTNKDMPRRGRHSQCRSPRVEVEQASQASAPIVRQHSYHHSHHHPHVAPSARRGGRGRLDSQQHENPAYVGGVSGPPHVSHRHRGRGPRRRCRWKNPRSHVVDDGSLSESESQESCGHHDDMCLTCGEHLSVSVRHSCEAQGVVVGAAVGRGRSSPGLKSEDSGSLGDEELHQAQLAAHRAFEALSRQMRHVSVRHSTTSTDRDREEMEDSEDDSTDSFISDMESNLQSEYRKFMTRVSQHLRDRRSKGRLEKRRLKQQKKELTTRMNKLDETEARLTSREKDLDERRREMESEKEALNNERAEIERQWQKFHEEMDRLEEQNKQQMSRVKLDVGGQIYTTSIMTLMKDSDSMLAAMFSGRHSIKQEEDGSVFIDRDGTHFRYILNYLRDGGFIDGSLPEDKQILKELLNEAVYYQLNGLVKTIQQIIGE